MINIEKYIIQFSSLSIGKNDEFQQTDFKIKLFWILCFEVEASGFLEAY